MYNPPGPPGRPLDPHVDGEYDDFGAGAPRAKPFDTSPPKGSKGGHDMRGQSRPGNSPPVNGKWGPTMAATSTEGGQRPPFGPPPGIVPPSGLGKTHTKTSSDGKSRAESGATKHSHYVVAGQGQGRPPNHRAQTDIDAATMMLRATHIDGSRSGIPMMMPHQVSASV